MKKLILIIIVITFTVMLQADGNQPMIRFAADFYVLPYFYEPQFQTNCNSINGLISLGAKIGKFTVGCDISDNYFSMFGQNPVNGLNGAWNIIRIASFCRYQPLTWFELKWGLGGAILSTSISYQSTGVISQVRGGLSALLDFTFRPPWKYIEISQLNRIDIFFPNDMGNPGFTWEQTSPYYYGGIRIVLHPFIDWIGLYTEIGGMPWFYTSKYVNSSTGMFVWGAGVTIDLILPGVIQNTKKQIRSVKEERADKKKRTVIEMITSQTLTEKLIQLKKAKPGDVIVFTNIEFHPDSDKIKEESKPILDRIARVLLDNPKIHIEVSGHTNDLGSPDEEYRLSLERSATIANYLINHDIHPKRVISRGYGGTKPLAGGINQINRRVEISVISN